MQTMYPAMVNSPETALSSAINSTQTTIPVLDASKLPAAPNLATIGIGEGAETILYTGKNVNNLTGCTRGFQGTAKAWDANTPVARFFTAYDHDTFKQNIEGLNTALNTHKTVATLDHPDGSVTSAKLGALAVIAGKIADGAVDTLARIAAAIRTTAGGTEATRLAVTNASGRVGDSEKLVGMTPTAAATGSTIMQRDASGRAKVAAPSATDDIARKAEVDMVQSNLNTHLSDYAIHQTAEQIRTASSNKLRAEVRSSAPSSPENGDIWYDSTEHKFKGYANGVWV